MKKKNLVIGLGIASVSTILGVLDIFKKNKKKRETSDVVNEYINENCYGTKEFLNDINSISGMREYYIESNEHDSLSSVNDKDLNTCTVLTHKMNGYGFIKDSQHVRVRYL